LVIFLQSCTVPLSVLQRSFNESSVTCIDAYDVISVKCKVDRDMEYQEEEIPVALSFPTIKCEQDEVSYISVCPLLDALCQYPEMLTAFRHLRISVDPST